MAKRKRFVCEGCAAVEFDGLLPNGWTGYGMSAIEPSIVANWCAECRANGVMDAVSVTTHRRARSVAKSRKMLQRLIEAAS